MSAIARQPQRHICWLRYGLWGLATISLLGGGCAGHMPATHTDPPEWLNSVLTTQTRIEMTPSMSVADRLTELRKAKKEAFHQLIEEILSLRIVNRGTIGELAATRPQLQQQIESYVLRATVVDADQRGQPGELRAQVEAGSELLELLHLNTAPEPVDRDAPSTGIVRPL
jgi:hypothetical protein